MANLIIELAKYIFAVLICFYTYQSFNVFRSHDVKKQRRIFFNQNYLMFLIHLMGYLVIYSKTDDMKVWIFYGAQVVLLAGILLIYSLAYPKSSRLLTNNMCMLLCVGFVMLTRLDPDRAFRQFAIVFVSALVTWIIPFIIDRTWQLARIPWVYGGIGLLLLLIVYVRGITSYGAQLSISIGGIGFQPSEFVKISFVFVIVITSFSWSISFPDIRR